MAWHDALRFIFSSLVSQRLRSQLTASGIAVGIAAVVLLTSIGEGIHVFVLKEFTQFGTHIIGINPGKTTTHGAAVGVFGSERPLTIEDARALERLPYIKAVVPVTSGTAAIKAEGRTRRSAVYGVGAAFPDAFTFEVAAGQFLPAGEAEAPRAFAVLGSRLRQELFGNTNPLGARIRIGGDQYRIVGLMASKGQVLGFDLDDALYIPTARALQLFNREGLMEIDVLYQEGANEEEVVNSLRRVLTARHGRDDVTITTQQQMLDVLGSILDVLTMAVGLLGSISLLVGGVGILTIMTIAVAERTSEVGLLRALGASRRQVSALFLGEAVVLATLGGLAGIGLGVGGALLLHHLFPALPVFTPWSYVGLALALASLIGLLAGVLPARHAARLPVVDAMRAE